MIKRLCACISPLFFAEPSFHGFLNFLLVFRMFIRNFAKAAKNRRQYEDEAVCLCENKGKIKRKSNDHRV